MRFNYKKISAIATSVLLTGLTVSAASAVSNPADLDNPAVVYGAESDDSTSATGLGNYISENTEDEDTGAEVGEESYLIAGTGNDLTLGEALNAVQSDLDEREMPTILAENTLEDDGVDFGEEETIDYDQKLQYSGSVQFDSLSDEDDYAVNTDASDDELPVLHIDQSSGDAYNLTVDFNQDINATAYDDSETVTIGGKELTFDPDMDSDELILLESTETVTIGAGETKDINGDEVEVVGANTDSDTATISINGVQHQVSKGDTEGDYYVNDIFMQTVPEKTASVKLFVGSTEWKFDALDASMSDFDIGGESMDGVQAAITSSNSGSSEEISSIVFSYTPSDEDADEKDYLEIGESLEDPLFDLSMIFESVEPELKADSKGTVEIDAGDTLDISFTSRNGNEYSISPYQLSENESGVIPNDDWYSDNTYDTLAKDSIFIAFEGSDSSEETLIYEVNKIDDGDSGVDGDEKVEFNELSSGNTITVDEGDEIEDTGLYVGDLAQDVATDDSFALNSASGGSPANVNTELITENGMSIDLTGLNTPGGLNSSETNIAINEDTDEDINVDSEVDLGTINVNVTYDRDSDDDVLDVIPSYTSSGDNAWNTTSISGDTDITYALSELGTYAESDKDEKTYLDIWTPTEQTVYNVYFSGEAEDSSSDSGSVVLKDNEDYSGRDVIIVGGSCINSAAADVLTDGEALCGDDFTAETSVGDGEFILKGSEDDDGNVVVVAAGYRKADTTRAVELIQDEDFDEDLSSVDKIYTVSDAEEITEAE